MRCTSSRTMLCVVVAAVVAVAAVAFAPQSADAHMLFYQPCPRGAPWSGGVCQLPQIMDSAKRGTVERGEYGGVGTTGQLVTYQTDTGALHSCGRAGQIQFKRTAEPHYTWKEGQAIDMSFGLQVDHDGNLVNIGYFSYDDAKTGAVDTQPDWFSPVITSVNARNFDATVRSTQPAFVKIPELPSGQLVLPLGSATPYGGLWATHLSWHSCVDAVIAKASYVITDTGTNAALSRVVAGASSTVSLVIDAVETDGARAADITSVTWTTVPAPTTAAAASTTYPYTYTIDPTALAQTPTLNVMASIVYANGRTAKFEVDVDFNELCGADFTCTDVYSHPVPNRQCNGAQCSTTNKPTFCCAPNEVCASDFTQAQCAAVDALTTLNTATKCTTPQCTASQCCDDNATCTETCVSETHYSINRAVAAVGTTAAVAAVRCAAKACVTDDCCAPRLECREHACSAPMYVTSTTETKLATLCEGECTDSVCCDLAAQCTGFVCTENSYPRKDIVLATHYCDGPECRNTECCYTTQCALSFDMKCPVGYTPKNAAVLATTDCEQDPCLPGTCCQLAKTCAADFVCATTVEFDRDGKRHTFHPKPDFATIMCVGDECTQSQCCDANDSCGAFATCGVGAHNPLMLTAATAAAAEEDSTPTTTSVATRRRLLEEEECIVAEHPAPAACPDGSTDVGTLDLVTCEWSGCASGRDGCVGAACTHSECCLRNQSCLAHTCSAGMVPRDFEAGAATPCTGALCLDEECCIVTPTCAVQGPTADVCGVAGATGAVALLPAADTILCSSHQCRFGECCASDVTCGSEFACASMGAATDLVMAAAAASGQVLTVGAWTARAPTTGCRGAACVLDECCESPPLRGTCAAFACPLTMIALDLAPLKVCTGVDCDVAECCTTRVMCPSTPAAQLALCVARAPLDNAASVTCATQTCVANECCQGAVVPGTTTPVTCASFVASETAVCNGALPLAVLDPTAHNCPEELCLVADCCRAMPTLPTCAAMTTAMCNTTPGAAPMQVIDGAAAVTCGTVDCTAAECCAPLTCRDFDASECDPSTEVKIAAEAAATTVCAGQFCAASVCCEAKPDDGGDGGDCNTTVNAAGQIVDCNGVVVGTVTVNSDGETVNSDGVIVDETGQPREQTQVGLEQESATEDSSISLGLIIGIVAAVLVLVALVLFFLWRRNTGVKAPGAGSRMRQKSVVEGMDNDLTGEYGGGDDDGTGASISVDQGDDLKF